VTILLVVMVIPFTILLLIATSETGKIERERAAEYLNNNLRIISSGTDNLLSSAETEQTSLLLNRDFIQSVNGLEPYREQTEYDDFKAVKTIKTAIRDISVRNYKNDAIESVYFYSLKAKRLFISNVNWNPDFNRITLDTEPWILDYENNALNIPWCVTKSIEDGSTILAHYCTVEEYLKDKAGLLSINLSPDVILDTVSLADMNSNGVYFVADPYGNTLHSPYIDGDTIRYIRERLSGNEQSGAMDVVYMGETLLVSWLTSNYSGLTYVVFSSLDEIRPATGQMTALTIWYVIGSILVIACCIILVYYLFFRPIRALADAMKQFETGDFGVKMPTDRKDEIGLINRQFNEMTNNIDTLITENYVNELSKRDIQLRLMQNQINEHFLYNTLDSIHWLTRRAGASDIGDMIRSLANFYRISLSSGRDMISAERVESMIADYLMIQKIRLGDTLRYQIDFDSFPSDVRIPKSIFIPLIENAIAHGINGRSGGALRVSLKRTDSGMRFSVSDDGYGIGEARMREIKRSLVSEKINEEDSFALRNINEQLRLYFGNDEGLQIESAEGRGTIVWFDIFLKADGGNDGEAG
jgi:sensor histidine kinase YesM